MALPGGSRVGPYEILAALGAGGMGEVLRARDTRLGRDVALKILPEAFAADADRLARFRREAQVLAALNHPNIAAIHGFEDTGAIHALVMELVEGDDLSTIIGRGALDVADAVSMARQIAEALESAHDRGIIHRDLKPANVKVRADGTVKVLDFGLAKAFQPEGASAVGDATNSPTLTAAAFVAPGTQVGVILGTAAYMAPEQAKGRPVDKRADVWAFGVVLYEMLAGRRAFDGEDVSTTLAAVLMQEPDWTALPAAVPDRLRQLIARCLDRDPRTRLRDIGEARIVLQDAALLRSTPALPVGTDDRRSPPILPWLVAAVGMAAAIAIAAYAFTRRPLPAAAVAFYVAPPPNVSPTSNGSDGHGGMLSPDGRHFAFSGVDRSTGEIAIYVRAMSVVDTRKIPGTEHGLYPFWSPNNRSIAFYAAGKLKRVDIDGQALQVICDARTGGWGGSWNAEDVIVAGLDDPGPLMKVSARGGTPEPATRLQVNEEDHDFPQFLPDQRHFLYTAWGNDAIGQGAAFVGSLDSTDQVLVRHDMSDPPSYSDPGQLVFIRKRTLMAQPFDLGTLKLQGEPVPLVTPARGPVVASASGALAYVTSASKSDRRVFWIDERGGDERAAMPAGYVADTAVSPDGSMVAYAKKDSETSTADIWIRDLASGGDRRLTFDPAEDVSPVWSPDSQTIVFASNRRGGTALYRKPASGAGEEAPISPATTASQLLVSQWHPTAGIVYYGGVPSWDLLLLGPDKTTTRLVATPASEGRGVISPDGRWLAYDARETSRFEIYVTTMPPSAGKWMATTQGGAEPRWSKDGKQLFYISSVTGALMAMDVSIAGTPAFGLPRRVHPGPIDWGWFSSHTYDVDPKTGRLLITVANQPGELTVLLNWRSLLAR